MTYISMTWADLHTVAIIVGAACMAVGYGINELYHMHKKGVQ